MSKEIYVKLNGKQSIAILKDGKLNEFIEETNNKFSTDTVIKGVINSIAPSLNAVFIDIGDTKTGYLPISNKKYKNNQEVVVQIRKEKIEDKGVSLSEIINIAGEFSVVSMGKGKCGVSSKITDEDERSRLKNIARKYSKEGYFIVIRTKALNRSEEEIIADINKSYDILTDIEDNMHNVKVGKILYQRDNNIIKILDRYFNPKEDTLIINDFNLYEEYFHKYPENNNIKYYSKEYDIYDYYNISAQINTIKYKKVWLQSGGYILIDYATAMTVIDVNSGKNNASKKKDDTFLQTNIEAAAEIARQIKLRNIGGIIVIDFINSENKKIRGDILDTFNKHIADDNMKITVGGFTKLGLFELTRQKTGKVNI